MAGDANYFEAELLQDLHNEIRTGAILIGPDSARYFSRLEEYYPICGSKIAWSKVPSAIELSEPQDEHETQAFSDFFRKVVADHKLSGPVIYMGDGVIDFALLASVEEFSSHLSVLFSFPQHHYFVADDFSWCAVFTFEGDMAFGYRPV